MLEFDLPDDEILHFGQSINAIALHPPSDTYCQQLPPYLGNTTRSHYRQAQSNGAG
jgi:hypothetical protein